MNSKEFKDWKSTQDLEIWKYKYKCKINSAGNKSLKVLLTLDEYLFKAFEADLTHPDQIGSSREKFNLSRINDQGDYTVESCRFITTLNNQREKVISIESKQATSLRSTGLTNSQGIKHWSAKLTEDQVIIIFLSKSSLIELAKEYKISPESISNIKRKRTWNHLTHNLT